MKTTDKNHPVFAYLLNAVPTTEEIKNGWDKTAETTADRLQFVLGCFRAEKGYEIARIGEQKAFNDWLMGLPSAINVDFENYRILEIAREWGSLPQYAKPWQENKILNNWFNFITVKFFQLCRYNKVN